MREPDLAPSATSEPAAEPKPRSAKLRNNGPTKSAKVPKMRNGIRQRSEGSWEYYIWVKDPDAPGGKRMDWRTSHLPYEKVKDLRTKEQAEALGRPRPATDRTVSAQWQIWLDGSVRMSNGRCEQGTKEETGRLHVLPSIGKYKVSEVTPDHIQTLLAQLLDGTAPVPEGRGTWRRRRLSPTTVHSIYGRMRTFFYHAERSTGIPSPFRNRAVVPPRAVVYEGEYWTIEQSAIAFEAMRGHPVYWPARIAYFTGLRASEIAGLGAEFIDVDGPALWVEWSVERLKKPINLKEPKSRTSRRRIPLDGATAEGLQPLVEAALARRATKDPRGLAIHLLFGNEDGSPRASYWMTAQFNKWQAHNGPRLGLPRIRFHDLRDSFAIMLLELGVDILTVSSLLGHAGVQITEERYARVTRRMADNAIAVFTRALEATDTPT